MVVYQSGPLDAPYMAHLGTTPDDDADDHEDAIRNFFAAGGEGFAVYRNEGVCEFLGYVLYRVRGRVLSIEEFAYRGNRAGAELLARVTREAKCVVANVSEANLSAQLLLRDMGFTALRLDRDKGTIKFVGRQPELATF